MKIENCKTQIIECQKIYFENINRKNNIKLWQTHDFKSIVQCLFVESTIDYHNKIENQWQLKLIVANLLSTKAMSSPTCEGYAPLLALIENTEFKKLLSLAMNSDLVNRNLFQQHHLLSNISDYLIYIESEVMKLFKEPSLDNWNSIKKHINEY